MTIQNICYLIIGFSLAGMLYDFFFYRTIIKQHKENLEIARRSVEIFSTLCKVLIERRNLYEKESCKKAC